MGKPEKTLDKKHKKKEKKEKATSTDTQYKKLEEPTVVEANSSDNSRATDTVIEVEPHKKRKKHKETTATEANNADNSQATDSIIEIEPHKKRKKHKKPAVPEINSADNSQAAGSSIILDGTQYLGSNSLEEIPPPRMSPVQREARRDRRPPNSKIDQTETVPLISETAVPAPNRAPDIAPEKTASCWDCFRFFRKEPAAETKPLLPHATASKMSNP